ncbi:helix-turn-helix domain-containing protein [Gracilibacillus alcaliphilus]|uniref:helix-turn-helix domain-containing protein n=1 Tax=Gracilibacillus alcaliphilus TaxID=1401441 RepID=UPI0019599A8D|nr:helix-turn-helix domain-containing protein [Gracilibacillus alcaliphilus]MBM7679167.1 AraC-like DNA-binding protein [Gracilibacillus alcaliphilus]
MDQVFLQTTLNRKTKAFPDIFCENDYIYYGLITLENKEKILIGPVQIVNKQHNDLAEFMICTHQLRDGQAYKLPYCDLHIFLQGIILLNHLLTGREVYLYELYACNGITEEEIYSTKNEISNIVFYHREVEIPHNPYDHEARKLESIQNGNLDLLIKCQKEIWIGQLGKVAYHPVRQAKNIAIIVIVLASRAAIQGGLSPELSFSMADGYILTIEKMTSVLQIQATMNQSEIEFTHAVRKLNKTRKKHILVEKTRDYIFKHLHHAIRVHEIGEALSVNKDYLSTVFSREEGITIQQYILREKVKYSEELLKYSDYKIYEISNYLSFSSQSHFSLSFKKIAGMTPKQYRNNYAKI